MLTKKYTILSFLSVVLMGTTGATPTQQPFYEYLNEVLIKAAPPKPTQPRAYMKETGLHTPTKPEDLSVKTLKEIEQKLLFVQLLQAEHPDKTFVDVLDKSSIEALNLVNRGEQYAALSRKFGVQTLFGDVMLTALLACPLTNATAIAQRQAFVRYLGENHQATSQIQQALHEIHSGQELLFTFFDDANKIDDRLLIRAYGPFGKSLPAIISYKLLDRFGAAISFLTPLATGLTAADNYKSIAKFMSDEPLTRAEKIAFLTTITTGLSWNAIKRAPKTLLDWHNPWAMVRGTGPTLTNKAGWLAFGCARVLAYDALIAWSYYSRFQAEKVNNAIYDNMQNRLMGVGKVVRGLQRINLVLHKEPYLLTQLPELAAIPALFENNELQKLLGLLLTHTFEGQPSYFSNTLRILQAYKLMCEQKQELVPALEAAGLVDNFAAAAQLVSRESAQGAFCYVTLIDNQLPVINLQKFWNPLLNFEQAIPNTATLGLGGDANLMLTGPNGSGKSTNMTAIILNVLLAQTFGIAAANQACITPFDNIYTYINVQENIQEGMSTFMAEAQRLEEIDRAIAATAANKRCLTVIDEGMRGTVAAEGVARLCTVCKRICSVPQSICVLATHFEEPTKLQELTNGRWINYHVEIDEPTAGNFVRLYTLNRGANNWWFTDEQKRKRFVDWLVKQSGK